MVDTLQKDLGILDLSKKGTGMSFMNAVGADLDDSMYRDNLEQVYSNDIQTISVAGQTINSEYQTIIIRPQVANGIINCDTLAIAGKFIPNSSINGPVNQMPINIPACFRALSIKISNFNKAISYGEIWAQQLLECISGAEVQNHRKGLWINQVDDDMFIYMQPGVNGNNGTQTGAPNGLSIGAALLNPGGVGNAILPQAYHSFFQQYMGSRGSGDYNFFCPLKFIFPGFFESIDFNLFSKFAGQIEFQFSTVNYARNTICPLATASATSYTAALPTEWQMTNLYVYYAYSRLTNSPSLLEGILRNEFEFRPCYPITYQTPWANTTTLLFTTTRAQRVRSLQFAVHQQAVNQTAALITSSATLYGGVSCLAGECILFPALRIQQITISASGRIVTINEQALSTMQLMQPTQNQAVSYPHSLDGPMGGSVWGFLRNVYSFDMTRFGGMFDEIGSSNGLSENIVITIQWGVQEDLSIYGAIPTAANGYNGTALGASPSNSMVYGFLTVCSKMVCRNGDYYEL